MGNYLTTAQAIEKLPRQYEALYNHDGVVAEDEIGADIDEAEGEVDAYLAVRYSVPVTAGAHAALLRGWTRKIWQYLAWLRSPGQKVPESVEAAYKATIEKLEKVAAGELSLGGATAATEATAMSDYVVRSQETPVMTRDDLAGF